MNCQKFEAIVSELARNQMMDADLRAEGETKPIFRGFGVDVG